MIRQTVSNAEFRAAVYIQWNPPKDHRGNKFTPESTQFINTKLDTNIILFQKWATSDFRPL